MRGIIQRRTYSTFALVVPFSDTSAITASQHDLLATKLNSTIAFYMIKENEYQLTVRLPEGASIQMIEPNPIHFARPGDKLWFYWDISEEQEESETRLFWSGLGLGIVIPIIVAATVELAKNPKASVGDNKNK